MIILFIVAAVQLASANPSCDLKGIACLNATVYQHCRVMNGAAVFIGKPQHCERGHVCHETISFLPCVRGAAVPAAPMQQRPNCWDSSQHYKPRAFYDDENTLNCAYYSICELTWWGMEEKIKPCPLGTGFSWESGDCSPNINPNTCLPRDMNTNYPAMPPPKVDCNLHANRNKEFPHWEGNWQNCAKRGVCQKVLWWWELIVRECPENTGFNANLGECTASINPSTCQSWDAGRTMGRTSMTGNSFCANPLFQNKKRPYLTEAGPNCAKYISCEQNQLLWWEERVRDCPSNTGFSAVTEECMTYINPQTCEEIGNLNQLHGNERNQMWLH